MALRKFAFNVASLSLARALQTVASIVAIPILARFLEPNEFGLIALSMPFILFCMAIGDAGLGQSLVRVKQSETLVWSSAFWLIMALSVGLALFVVALAWPYAILFEHPEVAPIVAVMAVSPFLQGLTALPIADLQQRERFQLLAATEVVSSFIALMSALVLAGAGAGVWALVSQATLYWVVKAAIILIASRFRPKFQFALTALEGHFTFSRDSAIGNLVTFFNRQIDPLVIGKMLGATPLGLYSMANRLAILPSQLLAAPAQSTMYVKMVALRHDIAALRDLVLISSLAVAILVFPPMAIAAASSHAFFVVFLSAKWADASILFAILAPVAGIQVVSTIWTPMLLATENTTLRLRIGIEMTVMWLAILPFAAMHGVVAVVVAYVVSYMAFSLLRSYNAFLSPVQLSVIDMTRALAAPLIVSALAALSHVLLMWQFHLPPLAEVALALAEMAIALAVLVFVCRRNLKAHVGQLRALFSAAKPLTEEGVGGATN